jgi:hypothetical protein
MIWLFSQISQETNAGRESLVDSGKMEIINKKIRTFFHYHKVPLQVNLF